MLSQNSENLIYVESGMPDVVKEVVDTSSNKICCRFHRRMNRHSSRRRPERMVFKNGQVNLDKSRSLNRVSVFPDIVTVFINARWRYTLLYCIMTYISTWSFFAGIWWSILYIHGDLEEDHLPHINNATDWTPCVREIYDFTSIFLFSIEIHTTIGYGTRSLTLACPVAMVLMCIESILGTIVQSFIVGIVFAKLTRPKNRAHTLLFSNNAVINQRDRNLCLTFRVGNTRKSRIIAVSVHAYLIRYGSRTSPLSKDEHVKLELTCDATDDIFFMFPIGAVHKFDENSPLFDMSAYDMLKSRLEILVLFEGTIESTGQLVQAKSSYTANEILWGHRFLQLMTYQKKRNGFVIDYSKFDETVRVNTPLCSGKDLEKIFHLEKCATFPSALNAIAEMSI